MMNDSISLLKTDPRLLDAVKSASKAMTPYEILEQRVSFVYGSMSKDSNMTKEQVRQVVMAQGGAVIRK